MLKDLHRRSLVDQNLGIRRHGALLAGQGKLIRKVFKRDGETCHVCGSRVPGHMEIDHIKGHRAGASADQLRTICQFCHNLKHPLWAAGRVRMVPILAPDIPQADLHRLAWVVLAWRGLEDGPIDEVAILGDIEARRSAFLGRYGCDSADSLFEAASGLPDHPSFRGRKARAIKTLARMDADLRFWPTELLAGREGFDPGSRLSTWGVGGFQVIADSAAAAIRDDQNPDFDKLRKATQLAFEKSKEAA